MEILLSVKSDTTVDVYCDQVHSHTFDLKALLPPLNPHHPLQNPIDYGHAIATVLCPPSSLVLEKIERLSFGDRIVLVAADNNLQAIPWEYLRHSGNYIIEDYHFVRGIPEPNRIRRNEPLHGVNIVALPSNPIDKNIAPLHIEGEWQRLRENVEKITRQLVLERVRPATLEALRGAVVAKKDLIIHFMGHGSYDEDGSALVFEKDSGAPDLVSAKDFVRRIRGTAFLVTLNACVTATPGTTEFANLAEALVKNGIPYALGMRFSITDDDARIFSRIFYRELSGGASVEEAVFQARLELAKSKQSWAIGVPVLYTALSEAVPSEPVSAGNPIVIGNTVRTNLVDVPRAKNFQGREDILVQIGEKITGDQRPAILTIHGAGGQGKTALAREVAERFAFAFPGGVFGFSLENLPTLTDFLETAANFLGIDTKSNPGTPQLEAQLMSRLQIQRVMFILDNAETLVNAIEARSSSALELVDFLKTKLSGTLATLLVTSRELLGWEGEAHLTLSGLSEKEGSMLFSQNLSLRSVALDMALVNRICNKVDGHPLSLQLLAGAFDNSTVSLEAFVLEYEQHLARSFDKYKPEMHRHYSLETSIETSLRYLSPELQQTLHQLTIFSTHFLPDLANQILAASSNGDLAGHDSIPDQLHHLWKRSFLLREERTFPDQEVILYRLLPVVRLYIRNGDQQPDMQAVQTRFADSYKQFIDKVDLNIPSNVYIVRNVIQDLQEVRNSLSPADASDYNADLGWILMRLGYSKLALSLFEKNLEFAQDTGNLELQISALRRLILYYTQVNDRASIQRLSADLLNLKDTQDKAEYSKVLNLITTSFYEVGLVKQAMAYANSCLDIARELADEDLEASILLTLGVIYRQNDEYEKALEAYLRIKEICEKDPSRKKDYAVALINMSTVYARTDRSKMIELRQEALAISREINDQKYIGEALNALGIGYIQQGDIEQGFNYLDEAILIFQSISDTRSLCNALDFKARFYRDNHLFDKALELYEQILPIVDASGQKGLYVSYLIKLGNVYNKSSVRDVAADWYRKAYEEARAVGDTHLEVAAAYALAFQLFESGNPDEAIILTEQVLKVMDIDQISRIPDSDLTREHIEKTINWYKQGTMLADSIPTFIEFAGIMGSTLLQPLVGAFLSGNQKFRVDIEFMEAVAKLLEAQNADLPSNHFHFQSFQQIKQKLQPRKRISEQGRDVIQQNTQFALKASPQERLDWRTQVAQVQSRFDPTAEPDEWDYLAAILQILDGEETALSQDNFYYSDYDTIRQNLEKPERINEAFRRLQQANARDEMRVAVSECPVMIDPEFIQLVDQALGNQIPDHLIPAFEMRLFWIRQIRIERLKQQLAQLQSGHNPDQVLAVLLDLGIAFGEIRVPHMALEYFEAALAITHDLDDRANEGIVHSNMGVTYQAILRNEQALEHYHKARDLFVEMEMKEMLQRIELRIQEVVH